MRGEPLVDLGPQDPADFQDENGDWLEEGWPSIVAVAACPNEECSFYDQDVVATLPINVDGVWRSVCGVSGDKNNLWEWLPDTSE